MNNKLAKKMSDLGFTKYEARAYISLLQNYPVTRYELSKHSGIPRSAIYEVIRRLESYGAVSVISTQPEKYLPLPPDQFIKMLEKGYSQKLEVFRDGLSELKTDIEPEQLWNLSGYQNLIAKARDMIQEAQAELYLSVWRRELLEIKEDLNDAMKRGVKVVIFSFTSIPCIGLVYSYDIDEIKLEKVWNHNLIVIRDHEELLMGEANLNIEKKAAWTMNKAILQIAENHIILDITLYGLRARVDVRDAIIETHRTEHELLAEILREKFPDSPFTDLDFSKLHLNKFI